MLPSDVTLDTLEALVAQEGKSLKRARTRARRTFMQALDQGGVFERLAYCPVRLKGAANMLLAQSVALGYGQAAFKAGVPDFADFVPPVPEERRDILQVVSLGEPEDELLAALLAAGFRRVVLTDARLVMHVGEGVLADWKIHAGTRVTVGRRLIPDVSLVDTGYSETRAADAAPKPVPAAQDSDGVVETNSTARSGMLTPSRDSGPVAAPVIPPIIEQSDAVHPTAQASTLRSPPQLLSGETLAESPPHAEHAFLGELSGVRAQARAGAVEMPPEELTDPSPVHHLADIPVAAGESPVALTGEAAAAAETSAAHEPSSVPTDGAAFDPPAWPRKAMGFTEDGPSTSVVRSGAEPNLQSDPSANGSPGLPLRRFSPGRPGFGMMPSPAEPTASQHVPRGEARVASAMPKPASRLGGVARIDGPGNATDSAGPERNRAG